MWPRLFKLLNYIVFSICVVSIATVVAILQFPDWHQELLRFSYRTWEAFLVHVGSTGPGFISPVIVSVLSVVLTMLCIGIIQGWDAMRKHWWETALITVVVLATTMLVVYGPQFLWQAAKLARDDHKSIVASNLRLVGDKTALASQLADATANAEQRCEQAKGTEIGRLKRQLNAACFNPDRRLTAMEQETLFTDLKKVRLEMEKQHQTPNFRIYTFPGDGEASRFTYGPLLKIFENAGWNPVIDNPTKPEVKARFEEQQQWMLDHGLVEGIYVFDKKSPAGFGFQVRFALAKVELADWIQQQGSDLPKQFPHLDDLTIWVGYKHTTSEAIQPIK